MEPFDPDGDLVVTVLRCCSPPPVSLEPVGEELALLTAAATQPGKHPESLELGRAAGGRGFYEGQLAARRVQVLAGRGQRIFSVGGPAGEHLFVLGKLLTEQTVGHPRVASGGKRGIGSVA